jgi:signal transduction histidine kinase
VRVRPRRSPPSEALRHRVARLERIPLRPLTARAVTGNLPGEPGDGEFDAHWTSKTRSICQLDPGWALPHSSMAEPVNPLALVAETPWWPGNLFGGPASEFLGRLWRHSVAVSLAAGSLARDANDPDPEGVARAGLLCRLGCWAVAAVDPEWMAQWWIERHQLDRRQREVADLGTDLDDLGRRLAERFECEPLAIDAAWLHDSHGRALLNSAAEPARLVYIQEACRWVEQTPWSLTAGSPPEGRLTEPRMRILVAEVQARTASAFVAADATSHEERMTRQNAKLRLLLAAARQERDGGARFLQAIAESGAAVSPEDWAARASLTWCAVPGVSAARVEWVEKALSVAAANEKTSDAPPSGRESAVSSAPNPRPPALVLPLTVHGQPRAYIHIWTDGEGTVGEGRLAGSATHHAWEAWAAMVADRALLERRVQTVVDSLRQELDRETERLTELKLEALGEFAAGAGHELNNPLAVIVGRAQLLLARTEDPETMRSLGIILSQASRAHRILRDLMFVARPPAPRPRPCRPSELLRACLRDLEEECAARGIRLFSEIDESTFAGSIDPDALRHLAEILLRNAIQATPAGGKVLVRSSVLGDELSWSFIDSGKGITPLEATHLFDPFFCGRQAGRGLGLGLPRAAKLVAQAGGRLHWSSNPGQGSVFQVHWTLCRQGENGKAISPDPSSLIRNGSRPPKSQAIADR